MSQQFVMRYERFGATIYDPRSLDYFFINQDQVVQLAYTHGFPIGMQMASICASAHPSLDVSGGKFTDVLDSQAVIAVKATAEPLPFDSIAAPIRVYFELTTRCNAGCRYCLNDSGRARHNELTSEEVFRTVQNMARDGVFEVRLTGGELTLREDFFDVAQAVQRCGMALSLNSNLLGGKRTVARLAELHPNLLITSLDAAEEPHTRHRGTGFQCITANVRLLREAGIPVRLNCVLSRDTLPCIEKFINQFAPMGCGFCFILVRPVGRAYNEFNPPSLKDLIDAVATIETKRKVYPDSYISTSFHVVMERELIVGGINLTGCNAIQKSFNINSDGALLPCAFLYELSPELFTLGNIRDDNYSVLPIWRESELLRTLRQRSSVCNQRCIGCSRFKVDCLGTCIFMELYSERTGYPDPYCQISIDSA
ncbi:MAG: radical SAM protein [Proteobacteria bacterium]|nr:radical SAM protein [Pseudomonadota bacterium]MBU4294732.1 radical SAM protein [Pseudomonadota bacterium]MCG2746284.1 radical SAM protein [Desulfobulbaceae bacterium]